MASGGANGGNGRFKESDYELALDVKTKPVEYTNPDGRVELRGGNQNVWFVPAGMSLAGEMLMQHVHAKRVPSAIANVGGVIPGHRMLVDTKAKHVKIIDRLSMPENRRILDELKRLSETEDYWHSRFGTLRKDVDFNVPDADWPKWIYCIRRAVDHGNMVIVRGENLLPSSDKCREMGEMVFNNANGISLKDSRNPFNVLRPPKADGGKKSEMAGAGSGSGSGKS